MSRAPKKKSAKRGPADKTAERRPAGSAAPIALLLAIVTFVAYLPALACDFVIYDDPEYVTSNGLVQKGVTWGNIIWAFSSRVTGNWHPLTMLSHMVDCGLYGLWPAGHHLTNVLLHVANALLLFAIFRNATGRMWTSAFIAALFALHPLHVESVAWIAERKDLLSTFFGFLSLWFYLRYARESKQPFSRNYLLALLAYVFALLSKPMLVTLPLVMLLLDYWPLARISKRAGTGIDGKQPTQAGGLKALVVEKSPFLFLSVALCIITLLTQRTAGAVASLNHFPVSMRMENAVISYARYLGKTFGPVNLSVFYRYPQHWPAGTVVLCVLLVVGLSALVWRAGRKFPFLIMGWLWFLGTLIPVIGLVQVGAQSMADRYTYIPIIGIFIIVTYGAMELAKRMQVPAAVCGVAGGAIVIACAALTARQVAVWRNTESLFTHALALDEHNFIAHDNLGKFLLKQKQFDGAIAHFQAALDSQPEDPVAFGNLGSALISERKFAEAIPYCEAALNIEPKFIECRANLATALMSVGRMDDAVEQCRLVLQQEPRFSKIHNLLAGALMRQGRAEEAVDHLRAAVQYEPNDADFRDNLGIALATQGKTDEAIGCFQEALRLDPSHLHARLNDANALAKAGKFTEAAQQYSIALQSAPNNAAAHLNLGLVLAKLNQTNEARAQLREALAIDPRLTQAKEQLEALHAGTTVEKTP